MSVTQTAIGFLLDKGVQGDNDWKYASDISRKKVTGKKLNFSFPSLGKSFNW
jgi:hypothetical protein